MIQILDRQAPAERDKMIVGRKTQLRGYDKILNFVNDLANKNYHKKFSIRPIEEEIDLFLKNCYQEELPVSHCLLDIMGDFQNKDNTTSACALILAHCDSSETKDVIVDFFESRHISDKIKRKLLLVLESYGSVDISTLIKHFLDKELIAEYALNSLLSYLGPHGENISTVFQSLIGQDTEFYQTLIANLTGRTDEQSAWILALLAEFPEGSVAETAIKALGYRKSSLAYELLDNLVIYQPTRDQLRDNLINRLAQSGISKPVYRTFIPHKCYFSWPDGGGNQILLVSRRTGRGRLFMVTFIINEDVGMQNCTVWADISAVEMESIVNGLEVQTGLKQIDYSLGIKVVENSLWKIVNSKGCIPPNFLFARRIFGAQKVNIRRHEVNLDEVGIEYIPKKIQMLLDSSEELLVGKPFTQWWINDLSAQEFIKKRPSLLNGNKIRKDIVNQFVKLIMEECREKWQKRFLITADFLHNTSPRIYRKQIETCLAIYLSITQGDKLSTIPFMVGLAQLTIENLRQQHMEQIQPAE